MTLATISSTPRNGFSRPAFGPADEVQDGHQLQRLLEYSRVQHPRMYDLIDQETASAPEFLEAHCRSMRHLKGHSEFDDEGAGGRGKAYREGQLKEPLARENW